MLLAFWPSKLGDSTLYTEEELLEMAEAAIRVRFHLHVDATGNLRVAGYHVNDRTGYKDRVPVAHAELVGRNFEVVVDDDFTLVWYPDDNQFPKKAMMHEKIESLAQLLGGYFHQDWPEEFDSDATALQAIIDSETKDQIQAGVAEIDSLLAETPSEIELRDVLIIKIGCYFDPESQGTSYEQWLKAVRGVFAQG
ncbi:contact-dependent growth inhibition system immunity protein [Marinobacter nauticus]|uniref:contact-dependent growth inhibition system immunity protein n=1 Tax=Marinobacter nauticus TaxID=2743 RepID=UPI001CFCD40C|nr:contact-dependent growth inhibition system immunity protein [Marinobacter nauticus]